MIVEAEKGDIESFALLSQLSCDYNVLLFTMASSCLDHVCAFASSSCSSGNKHAIWSSLFPNKTQWMVLERLRWMRCQNRTVYTRFCFILPLFYLLLFTIPWKGAKSYHAIPEKPERLSQTYVQCNAIQVNIAFDELRICLFLLFIHQVERFFMVATTQNLCTS